MRVIICGAGRVGFGIAERLSSEGNDVSVIDTSAELIRTIRDTLDVRGFVGHGAHPEVLQAAGINEADMIIAVTLHDEINMVACQVAHSLFNVPVKIARIRSQSYMQGSYKKLFSRDDMPIDVVISPEISVGEMVLRRISLPGAMDVLRFANGEVLAVAIECSDDCPVINTPLDQLSELFPDLPSTVVGVIRNEKLFVPHSSDQLKAGDVAYVVTTKAQVKRTLSLFGHDEEAARRIIIAGGGNIGLYVAQQIESRQSNVKVKIIEANRDQALNAADKLTRSVVLHGSVIDQKILNEADIEDTDLLVTTTNSDQINILGAVMAKRLGCKATMALVNDPSFHDYTKAMGIDGYVNPRSVTISNILQHVRRGRIRSVFSVSKGAAEIIEADALDTSPLVGKMLREQDLPAGMRIGAIMRDGKFIKPDGDTKIKANDRVIIFALAEAVAEAEQLFRVSIDFF